MEGDWETQRFIFSGFEWDYEKATKNDRKHKVSFEDAAKIFAREVVYRQDLDSSEERYIALGFADTSFLAVVFAERSENIRIISARRATAAERRWYGTHIS